MENPLFILELLGMAAVLRIRDVYPGSEFFPSRIRFKELKYLNPTIVSKLSEILYDPGCSSRIRILIFSHPGSRIQLSKRHRIPDPQKTLASRPMLFQPRRSTLTSPTSCSTTTRRAAPRSWRNWTPRQCCPSGIIHCLSGFLRWKSQRM